MTKRPSLVAGAMTALVVAATLGLATPVGHASGSHAPAGLAREGLSTAPSVPAAPDRLLVKLAPRSTARHTTAMAAVARLSQHAEPLGGRWVGMRALGDPAQTRHVLARTPGVAAVQRDHVRQSFADTYYRRYQPYLRASMDIDRAWSRSSGRGVTVAVLDSGVDVTHEDLGHVLTGRDFVDGDRVTQDPVGHGTFVAGVVAARRDNHKGIAGVSRASILPVRVLNAKGYGRDSTIAEAIRWATRQGADILNLSLGGVRKGAIMRDAIDFADRRGTLVVAAAGNDGGTSPRYPAAFDSVVAVGASDLRDRMAWWSQHGDWLDVIAPGTHIASTTPGDAYAIGSGTSFSAPLVSGAAALLLGANPGWSDEQLRSALLAAAADAGPVGPDPYTGLGVPDVDGALGGAAKPAVPTTGPIDGTSPVDALPLTRLSSVPASSPEGTDRWFTVSVHDPTRVTVTARADGRSGVMRGDIDLSIYDSALRRLDHSAGATGLGREQVHAVVDDTVYVKVTNLEDTRWPSRVELGLSRETARAGQVEAGGGARPVIVGSAPEPESYGADPALPLTVTTGVTIKPATVDAVSMRLVDGETGQAVPVSVTQSPGGWQVTPDVPLQPTRPYALVLDGVESVGGHRLPYTRVGFRTG